jgi:tRNA(fMet)-specific endonuclease VapC
MSYLLDADWTIQALAGRMPTVSELDRLASAPVASCWVTAAEVYKGAFKSSNPHAHLRQMRQFLSRYRMLSIDDAIAERFADLRANLRRRGEMIPDLDLFVAATALTYDLTVLTFNQRHYERIPDLQLYQPT